MWPARSLEFEGESVHALGGHSDRLGDGGVVRSLQIPADLVALGSDRQEAVLVLDVPYLQESGCQNL